MKNFLKVLCFSLLVITLFAGYANYGIPQIEPALPPVEEKLELGTMTMEKFIKLGERLYNGKGTCTLCHNPTGGRAPLLASAATVAAERLQDTRYQGKASSVVDYLYESMVEPSAYVVSGFGKAGSNDTESPMPNVAANGIDLSDAELKAIIAYLQDLAGADVTVSIPTDAAPTEAKEETANPPPTPRTALDTPAAIIAKFTCGACHKVADQVGAVGPDLTTIGATRDKAYLRRSLLDPNADAAAGFMAGMMPNIYSEQMSAKELEMLVDYLAGLK